MESLWQNFIWKGVKEKKAHTVVASLMSYCHPVAIQETFMHSCGGTVQMCCEELYYSSPCRTWSLHQRPSGLENPSLSCSEELFI